jgi:hypothetical protein
VAKADDSSLDPEQLRAAQKAARRALDRASAWGVFPTPIADILDAAETKGRPASAFEPRRIVRSAWRSSRQRALGNSKASRYASSGTARSQQRRSKHRVPINASPRSASTGMNRRHGRHMSLLSASTEQDAPRVARRDVPISVISTLDPKLCRLARLHYRRQPQDRAGTDFSHRGVHRRLTGCLNWVSA